LIFRADLDEKVALFMNLSFCHSSHARLSFVISLLALALSFAASPAPAQVAARPDAATVVSVAEGKAAAAPGDILPARLGKTWQAGGAAQRVDVGKLPAGQEADLLKEYGLQSAAARVYADGKSRVKVTAFEMKYPAGAYGLWTYNRALRPAGRVELHSGQFLLRVESDAAPQSAVEEVASAVRQHLAAGAVTGAAPLSAEDLPLLASYLPGQNKIPDSEKYLVGPVAVGLISELADLKDLIDFTGGTHAAVAEYEHGGGRMKMLLVEYQTPQFAADGYARFSAHLSALSPDARQRRVLKRTGNYVIEAVNVSDVAAAQSLVDQVKYMVKVHWEGEKLNAVPWEFRPPDPVALNEVRQTGRLLYAIFYWIGVLMVGTLVLGMLTGGAVFYWRRRRFRRAEVYNAFSDAGGMVCLNLEAAVGGDAQRAGRLLDK
jgi:hypothetical protein